jgi:hypothetical protein
MNGRDVQLAFAKRKRDGRMVGVKAVANGLQCDCVCACCGLEVIAAQGPTLAWHFKHRGETACQAAHETLLHLFAKQILSESVRLTLPADPDLSRASVALIDAEQEVRLDEDVIADVVCTTIRDEPIAIEIFVTHRREEKREAYSNRLQHAAIEIDLSPYRDEQDEEILREAVLRSAPRQWLCPVREIREARERRAVEEARRAAEQAERDARWAAHQAELHEKAEAEARRVEALVAESAREFREWRRAQEFKMDEIRERRQRAIEQERLEHARRKAAAEPARLVVERQLDRPAADELSRHQRFIKGMLTMWRRDWDPQLGRFVRKGAP